MHPIDTGNGGSGRAGAALRWLPVVVWCAVLFWLSSRPGSAFPKVKLFPHQDKAVHVVLYVPLGLAMARALRRRGEESAEARRVVLLSTFGCFAYGVTDEIHQLFVPSRSFDLLDLGADTVGGCAGATAYVVLRRRVALGALRG